MNDKVQGMDDIIQEMREENEQQNARIEELTHVVEEQATTIENLSKVSEEILKTSVIRHDSEPMSTVFAAQRIFAMRHSTPCNCASVWNMFRTQPRTGLKRSKKT